MEVEDPLIEEDTLMEWKTPDRGGHPNGGGRPPDRGGYPAGGPLNPLEDKDHQVLKDPLGP